MNDFTSQCTLNEPGEATWVEVKLKDPGAPETIYRAWAPPVYHHLVERVGSAMDAEDIISQVFLGFSRIYQPTDTPAILPVRCSPLLATAPAIG